MKDGTVKGGIVKAVTMKVRTVEGTKKDQRSILRGATPNMW